jgi:hypothetical protein
MTLVNALAAAAVSAVPAQITNLFLIEDLDDVGRTRKLAESDLNALHAVADWTKTFVARPHKDLGRAGARVSLRACGLGT